MEQDLFAGDFVRREVPVSGVDLQASFIGDHFNRTKTTVNLQIGRWISKSILSAQDLFHRADRLATFSSSCGSAAESSPKFCLLETKREFFNTHSRFH